jgi:hypothetical protein
VGPQRFRASTVAMKFYDTVQADTGGRAVSGLSLTGTAGLNPAEGAWKSLCCERCVSGTVPCVRPIPRPEDRVCSV